MLGNPASATCPGPVRLSRPAAERPCDPHENASIHPGTTPSDPASVTIEAGKIDVSPLVTYSPATPVPKGPVTTAVVIVPLTWFAASGYTAAGGILLDRRGNVIASAWDVTSRQDFYMIAELPACPTGGA
jgi:hypothetical protein